MKLKYLTPLPLFLLFAFPVFAKDATPSASPRQEIKCQIISRKLTQAIGNYGTRKDLHVASYQRLSTRLTKVADSLTAKGADTAKLKTDLATLNTMIEKLSTDYQAFIANLSTSQTQACTLTLEQIKTKLADARTLLKDFRTQSKAIHNFIKNTIRKDLLALRTNDK